MSTEGPSDENPFASPLTESANPHDGLTDSEIRATHINQELAIRFGGMVLLAMAVLPAAVMLVVLSALIFNVPERGTEPLLLFVFLVVFYSLFTVLFIWCGRGLRRFDPPARRIMNFISILLVFIVPTGTVLGIYFWWHGMGAKARYIFSDEYAEVRKATEDQVFEVHPFRVRLTWGIVLGVSLVVHAVIAYCLA